MAITAACSNVDDVANLELTETTFVTLLVVASVVSIGVRYLRLPYTVALVIVGLFLGLGATGVEITLSEPLIMLLFLPPLLFEGAINMDLEDVRRRAVQLGVMAIAGTLVVVGVLAGAFIAIGMPTAEAVLLAVILAPTDPVSVLAIFKEHGVGSGLRTLMEGESIFNDAIAIVLYLTATQVVSGVDIGVRDAIFAFGSEVVIGIVVGVIVGFAAHRLMRTVDDHLVEITLSLVTAFGSFLLADRLHGSGVIATVTAGLLIGNYGVHFAMSPGSRVVLTEFWEVMAFLINSLLFLMLGLGFDIARLATGTVLTYVGIGIVAMLVGRAVLAYGLLAPFTGADRDPHISRRWQHAIFWGGLRGAIPIALVLGLERGTIASVDAVAVVFGVVLFSLLVQGLSYKPVLNRLGLIGAAGEAKAFERAYARSIGIQASLDELHRMRHRGEVITPLFAAMRDELTAELDQAHDEVARLAMDSTTTKRRQIRRLARRMAAAQRSAVNDAARRGLISDNVVAEYSERLDDAIEAGEINLGDGASIDDSLFPDDLSEP